jgi:hypothetical protein
MTKIVLHIFVESLRYLVYVNDDGKKYEYVYVYYKKK